MALERRAYNNSIASGDNRAPPASNARSFTCRCWCVHLSSPSPFGQTAKNVATQILQGAGPATVDLNQYNLPLDQIREEWTANLVQKPTDKEATAKLGVRSSEELFVDTVTVAFARDESASGLGIQLQDLVEGREDGMGITVVTGLVEEGMAYGTDILPGDSISEVAIVRTDQLQESQEGESVLVETQQEFVARTECLSYDATADSITSLPVPSAVHKDTFRIKLRRIRRKPKVSVKLQYPPSQKEPDATIEMFAGENLRQGMLIRGVKLNDELAKRFDTKNGGNCGAGGLCRTCAVSIIRGGELLNPQRVAEEQMLADNPRWRLACKAIVGFGMQEGEMTVRVNPRQWE